METNTNAASDNNAAEQQYKYKDKDGTYKSNLIVVLDMDECLIHSQFLSDVDKYRQVEDRPSSVSSDDSSSSESSSAASSNSDINIILNSSANKKGLTLDQFNIN